MLLIGYGLLLNLFSIRVYLKLALNFNLFLNLKEIVGAYIYLFKYIKYSFFSLVWYYPSCSIIWTIHFGIVLFVYNFLCSFSLIYNNPGLIQPNSHIIWDNRMPAAVSRNSLSRKLLSNMFLYYMYSVHYKRVVPG